MIYGVVGTLDRETMMKFGLYNMKTGRFQRQASKKGNGKTLVLTYYGYREATEENRKVFTNYHTTFSIYRPVQKIMEDLGRILDLAGKYGAYGTITEIIKRFDLIFAHYNLSQVEQTELYEMRSLYLEYFGSRIFLTEFQKFFNSLGTSTKTIKWVEGILTQLRKLDIDLMWDSQRPISAGNRGREYTETYLVPQKFHEDDLSPCDKDICPRDHLIYVFCDVPFREKELVILIAKEVGQFYETDEIIGDLLVSPQEKRDDDESEPVKKKRPRKVKVEEDQPEIPVITNKPQEVDEVELKEIKILGRPEPVLSGQEDDLPVELFEEIPEGKVEIKILKGAGEGSSSIVDPSVAHQIIDELNLVEPEGGQEAMDRLEMEMITASSNVPEIIKKLLPEYKARGKIHNLFLKYFNEDGAPIPPGNSLSDQILFDTKEAMKRGLN